MEAPFRVFDPIVKTSIPVEYTAALPVQISNSVLLSSSRSDRSSSGDAEMFLRLLQTHLIDQVTNNVVDDLLVVPLSEGLRFWAVSWWEPERLVELAFYCASSVRGECRIVTKRTIIDCTRDTLGLAGLVNVAARRQECEKVFRENALIFTVDPDLDLGAGQRAKVRKCMVWVS